MFNKNLNLSTSSSDNFYDVQSNKNSKKLIVTCAFIVALVCAVVSGLTYVISGVASNSTDVTKTAYVSKQTPAVLVAPSVTGAASYD